MITLALDSTAKAASCAVLKDERCLALYTIDNGLTQSELLLPMAESALKSLGLNFCDIDLYAASVGPGSFTGVRIGVSLIKGLAFGSNTPCVQVSTLEALAENLSPLEGFLLPCMDARRGQVYTATFESDGKELKRLTEDRAISLNELADELLELPPRRIYLSGDGLCVARRALIERGVTLSETPPLLVTQNAYSVGLVALRKYARGEVVTDSEISPTYLRLPQAERERLEREMMQK